MPIKDTYSLLAVHWVNWKFLLTLNKHLGLTTYRVDRKLDRLLYQIDAIVQDKTFFAIISREFNRIKSLYSF